MLIVNIETNVYEDRIEIVYKEIAMFTHTYYFNPIPDRVFKIVFSCKDGK